jgi:chromosome segregation ATPase
MFTEKQIEQLKELLQPIENRLTNLEKGQAELRKDVDGLKGNVHNLQQGQEKLWVSIKNLQQGQAEIKNNIKQLQNGQTAIKRRLTRIEKDINSLGKYFDSHIIHQRERIDHIENHLRLI